MSVTTFNFKTFEPSYNLTILSSLFCLISYFLSYLSDLILSYIILLSFLSYLSYLNKKNSTGICQECKLWNLKTFEPSCRLIILFSSLIILLRLYLIMISSSYNCENVESFGGIALIATCLSTVVQLNK